MDSLVVMVAFSFLIFVIFSSLFMYLIEFDDIPFWLSCVVGITFFTSFSGLLVSLLIIVWC